MNEKLKPSKEFENIFFNLFKEKTMRDLKNGYRTNKKQDIVAA